MMWDAHDVQCNACRNWFDGSLNSNCPACGSRDVAWPTSEARNPVPGWHAAAIIVVLFAGLALIGWWL